MKQLSYKGKSIEREQDGSFSIYFIGNAYATRGGFTSMIEAQLWIDKYLA